MRVIFPLSLSLVALFARTAAATDSTAGQEQSATDAPKSPAEAAPAPAPAAQRPAPDAGKPAPSGLSTQQTLAVVAGAVGVVDLAIGTIFGIQAASNWSDAQAGCDSYPYGCTPQAVEAADRAHLQATISTFGFVAAGVTLAGAAVLWFTAGSGKASQVAVGLGPGEVRVRGSF